MSGAQDEATNQELLTRIEELEKWQARARSRRPMGVRVLLVAAVAIAAGGVAGVAFAKMSARIPDAKGVIHACYSVANGNLRVTNGGCRRGERAISWYNKSSRAFCPHCKMALSDLTKQDLRGSYLAMANLTSSKLSQALLTGADLRGADFRKSRTTANGQPQTGPPTNLQGAYLNEADLQTADLEDVDAPSADFAGADLSAAYLQRGNFFNAEFFLANLTQAHFSNAYLRSAKLQNTRISEADFTEAILSDAQLGFAHGKPYSTQNAVWGNTQCPDLTNSDNNPNRSCDGHWLP